MPPSERPRAMRRTEDVANEPNAFDKDFGYLMPFLDKVAAAASGLPDASARAELVKLIGSPTPGRCS